MHRCKASETGNPPKGVGVQAKRGQIPRNEAYIYKYAAMPPAQGAYALVGRGIRVTQPFDASTLLSIDPERCRRVDFAQGREPAERQMGVLRQPLKASAFRI